MATSLNYCDDFEEVNEPLPELRWHIEVHETNYQFTKQIAVKGDVTIGQLTFAVVKEIGKNLVYFSIVFKMMFRKHPLMSEQTFNEIMPRGHG